MNIPLTKIYAGADVLEAVRRVLEGGQFVKGPENRAFERELAASMGADHVIAASSGTAALLLALQALGVRPGDEVLVPSFSFAATVTPLLTLRAKPVFVDIDPETYTIDTARARRKATKTTRGIIPVHLYGHPADLGPLVDFAHERDLWLLEDACQAHGARYKGRHVGTFGDAAAFSFYPSKNMTVCGDGGAVATNRSELADTIRSLVDAGRRTGEKYVHDVVGLNYRLSEIHAAIGRVQLSHLPAWVDARRQVARAYTQALSQVREVQPPVERPGCTHSYYVYTIRTSRRSPLAERLAHQGIATGLYYPTPIHRQPFFRGAHAKARLPETDRAAAEVLSLPIHPWLARETVGRIARAIEAFHAGA